MQQTQNTSISSPPVTCFQAARSCLEKGCSCFKLLFPDFPCFRIWQGGGGGVGAEQCFSFPAPLRLQKWQKKLLLFSWRMQASPGQPTRAASAQLGCQQSFRSIKDRRTPGNFTARLLFNLYTQIPKTFLYNNVLSSQYTTVHLHLKVSSVPAAQSLTYAQQRGQRWGWVRGSERAATTHSTHLCKYLQGLGCFRLLYLSFLQGLPTSPSTRIHHLYLYAVNQLLAIPWCYCCLAEHLFSMYVISITTVGPNKSIPYRFCTNM